MELKQTKVYVPTHEILKDGWVNLGQDKREFIKTKEGYFLTKEELESVIEDAFNAGYRYSSWALSNSDKEQYIKQILK